MFICLNPGYELLWVSLKIRIEWEILSTSTLQWTFWYEKDEDWLRLGSVQKVGDVSKQISLQNCPASNPPLFQWMLYKKLHIYWKCISKGISAGIDENLQLYISAHTQCWCVALYKTVRSLAAGNGSVCTRPKNAYDSLY